MQYEINDTNLLVNISNRADIDAVQNIAYIKSGEKEIEDAVENGINQVGEAVSAYIQESKDWATKMDGKVNNEDYSSKYYAGQVADIMTNGVIATGTTEKRTLQNRFADVINVKDFGAKGDGVTDDTAAIQAALDLQAVTGAIIYIPEGDYLCGQLLYKTKVKIYGDGVSFDSNNQITANSSKITLSDPTGVLLSADSGADPYMSTIQDVALVGNGGTAFMGRSTGSNKKISFEKVYFEGFDVGIVLSDAFDNYIQSCKFKRCTKGILYKNITFMAHQAVTGDLIENCYFGGCSDAGVCTATGDFFDTLAFINDKFEYCGTGIKADDSYRVSLINCYFEGNTTEGTNLKRCVNINCFSHSSLGNNAINYDSGIRMYYGGIYVKNQSDIFYANTATSPNNVKTTRLETTGYLRMGSTAVPHNTYFEATTQDTLKIGIGNSDVVTVYKTQLKPSQDDTINCGSSGLRWKEIFAANGTINTSDERQKQDIEDIDEAVFRAWGKVDFKQFHFKDAVAKKGENARIHFGVIAQRVKEAFESEGLDAFKYGLLCYDEWEDEYKDVEVIDKEAEYDENGDMISQPQTHIEQELVLSAGNRYGVRYNEALALECAYQRWKLEQLEQRLA